MRNTNKQLMRLIKKHTLTSSQIAKFLSVEITTVSGQRRHSDGQGFRWRPPALLEIKLDEKNGAYLLRWRVDGIVKVKYLPVEFTKLQAEVK